MKLSGGIALLVLPLLVGCAHRTWAPGPTATMPAQQAAGQCKLVAMGAQQGFVAVGSAAYVGGAALGNAIGNAIRTGVAFDSCMEGQGFIPVPDQPAQPPVPTR